MDYDDVVRRDDPRFPTMVRGLNQRFVGDPRYVELCATPAGVVDALQRALDLGLRPTVRAGGHCYEDFVTDNPGGVTLDLAPLRAVERDAHGRYGIQAGAHLGDVYTQLYKRWGVTIPGGSCFPVGAGGHICGGGYGLLSRLHGLTVDHLSAVDVAVVDRDRRARLVTVSRDSGTHDERELFWAHTGGGGGNFGIVTTYWFDDPPAAPGETHLMTLAWDWSTLSRDDFTVLVARYGAFFEEHSAVGSPYAGLFALLHLPHCSAPQIVLTAQYVGPEPGLLGEFKRAICAAVPEPVPQRAPVGYHPITPASTKEISMPWLLVTEALSGSGPPQRAKYKSAYMKRAFPPGQIETMYAWLTHPAYKNPASLLQVDSYGCQVNAVAPDATAVPQRSSVLKLQYQAYWTRADEDPENLAWIRGFYDAMYGSRGPEPGPVMDGAYVNYPDVDLVDWPRLYYKESYRRLQAVKRTWDPLDVFHHKQSIRLPSAADHRLRLPESSTEGRLMASLLNPYLMFPGTTREAMEFYQGVFGGTLDVNTFGEFGESDPDLAGKVMHARLETASGFTLMASDPPPGMPVQAGNTIAVSLSGDDADELRGYWEKLSDGGDVQMPLEKQMWGDTFGMCTDRFGLPWMVNIAGSAG